MQIYVETPRLILREMVESDVDGFFELDSDPEVHRFLGNHTVKSKEECTAVIKYVRQQYVDFGIGRWAVIEKQSGSFMGWTGIKFVTDELNNHKNFYDLGYRFIRKYWGKGYAGESALASFNYASEVLKVDQLYASTHNQNIASQKIITKLGFQFRNEFMYDGAIHFWYAVNFAEH
ncbi:MAG: GNAT family N-acetyltransferase [Bacteroidetes bacterium]|nr:GNAT family N-acetyltransferase [Bacteroidota bacterium]